MSISEINLDRLLDRAAGLTPLGRSVDAVLPKQSSLVWRRRKYRVYLPAGYDGSRPLPMVMVLHGCNQTHIDIQAISCFENIADREQFIVVYPFVTSYADIRSQYCWGWWQGRQRHRNRGENGDIHQIVSQVASAYAVDQSRLHICGLSAGAAMSVVALSTYSDIWKSGASVAGVPYGESARAVKYSAHFPVRYRPMTFLTRMLRRSLVSAAPPLLIIQSEADAQVGLALSVNLRECWRRVAQLSENPARCFKGTTQKIRWKFEQYLNTDGKLSLGYFTVQGIEHGWMGGAPGSYSTPDAPNISELIWAFFDERHQANEHRLVSEAQHLEDVTE